MNYKLSDVIAVARQEVYDEYIAKGYHLKLGNGHGAIWLDLPFPENKAKLFFAALQKEIILQLVYPKTLGSKDTPRLHWDNYAWLKPFNYTKDNCFSLEERIKSDGKWCGESLAEYALFGLTKSSVEIAKKMLEFYIKVAGITADAI